MSRKAFSSALGILLLALCSSVHAQQPNKVPQIGYLTGSSLAVITDRTEAFRQGLRELGYVDGKNIVIEWKSAEGKLNRLPALAAELVRLKVDIIVTTGAAPTRAAKEATRTSGSTLMSSLRVAPVTPRPPRGLLGRSLLCV